MVENMVGRQYPAPQEEQKEEEMEEQIIQMQENDDSNADGEQMECVPNEECSNDNEYLEGDEYSADIGIRALEDELDHLQSALDHLERKNDDIHAELIDLLRCNREARKQFQESLSYSKSEEQQSK